MSYSTLINFILLLTISSLTISCSKGRSGDASKSSKTETLLGDDSDGEDTSEGNEQVSEYKKLYDQNFESFDLKGNWMLSDFGLQGEADKELYIKDGQLGFDIQWTKRTRNHLADKLGYSRDEMTHAFTNSICEPKIEMGKESAYTSSNSNNIIAELDSDISHCGMKGSEPAALTLRSFVPTKIGYKYKVKVRYMMRSYGAQTEKSYKDLVVRFGNELEKFDPIYNSFQTAELEITAERKFSKLVLRDNGLPDSFGVLIDDILIEEGGKAPLYDQCEELFNVQSSGFKKCIKGEVATDNICDLSNFSKAIVKASKNESLPENRRNMSNIFNASGPKSGEYNFFSLGLKGKVSVSCAIDGHAAKYSIEGKTIALREISWGNVSVESYPELAKVRVKLSDCHDDSLNRTITIGTVETNEFFSYRFQEDSEGRSFSGCNMDKLIIKDITPSGPSKDGFDLNSLQFSN